MNVELAESNKGNSVLDDLDEKLFERHGSYHAKVTVHYGAQVSLTARIGDGSTVWPNAVIGADVVTGKRCVIGSSVYVGKGSILGDDVHLQHGAFLPNNSILGNRVFVGPNATFTDDRYPRSGNSSYIAEPPKVASDASIGAGAVILPGILIGHHALVGAGAVVTRHVAPNTTVIGNPAKELKKSGYSN